MILLLFHYCYIVIVIVIVIIVIFIVLCICDEVERIVKGITRNQWDFCGIIENFKNFCGF